MDQISSARAGYLRALAIVLLATVGAGGTMVAAGIVDTPLWSPVDRRGCELHGMSPRVTVAPGVPFLHGVPLPASRGGTSRIERIDVLGSARDAIELSVLQDGRGVSIDAFGSYSGSAAEEWRPRLVPLAEARIHPAPSSDSAQATRSGALLAVMFRGEERGVYTIEGFRMVFRQGWRKATCIRDGWDAVVTVSA